MHVKRQVVGDLQKTLLGQTLATATRTRVRMRNALQRAFRQISAFSLSFVCK
ncbi:unnamed protein product, partial [Ceratitis capitata]